MRRSSVVPVLVSNGVTSFIRNSRSLISRIRILDGFLSPVDRPTDLEIAPRCQQIFGGLLSCQHRDRGISTDEPPCELFTNPRLHRLHALHISLPPLLELCRN